MHVDEALLDADGRIDAGRWLLAVAAEEPVGTCHCGQPAVPGGVDTDYFGRRTYPLYCVLDPDHEAVVPERRVVRTVSRLDVLGLGQAEGVLDAARELEARRLGERLAG